jgi:hypothetical protein
MPVARFLAELAGMCAVMCIGGSVLSLASFAIAKVLGYSNLAQQALELSAAIVTVCLALPMAVYMAVRGYGQRRNVVMTGSTVGVGIVVIALLWSGAISASGPQTWQSLFGLICTPDLPGHGRGDAARLQQVQRPSTPSPLYGLISAGICGWPSLTPALLPATSIGAQFWRPDAGFRIGEADRMRRPQGDLDE